jgi:two-component system, OmpR family, clock-associated histidine kinase SasA
MSVIPSEYDVPDLVQLLLFVDERTRGTQQYQDIISFLHRERAQAIALQIIDVVEQPSLAEYFRLVATPTLVKLYPSPRQTFAGSNLLRELEKWLPNWIDSLGQASVPNTAGDKTAAQTNLSQIGELIRLADEVFQLRQQQAELEEQLRFKEQAINNIAHDLRNPLTAASLALDTLSIAKNPEDMRTVHLQSEMIQKLLQRAKEQVHVADRMVTDILQLSQGVAVNLTIKPHPCELQTLVEMSLEQVKDSLEGKQQQITTDLPQDLPLLYVDSQKIQQVLINLLDNASKYTSAGSKIQIAALHRTTQKIQVSIMDNGEGIPEADFKRVFQKNYRVKRSPSVSVGVASPLEIRESTQSDGYGLGLPLCKKIVLAHYGQIWVESSGRGTTFHFTLPVYA